MEAKKLPSWESLSRQSSVILGLCRRYGLCTTYLMWSQWLKQLRVEENGDDDGQRASFSYLNELALVIGRKP